MYSRAIGPTHGHREVDRLQHVERQPAAHQIDVMHAQVSAWRKAVPAANHAPRPNAKPAHLVWSDDSQTHRSIGESLANRRGFGWRKFEGKSSQCRTRSYNKPVDIWLSMKGFLVRKPHARAISPLIGSARQNRQILRLCHNGHKSFPMWLLPHDLLQEHMPFVRTTGIARQ